MKADQHFPIDAVVTWVDGNDPVLNAKRAVYVRPEEAGAKDIAAPTRYANRGEIHWCIRSINKFMPWVNRIFIVTDGQDPKVESRIPVEIIDHSVIFSGYEQYLPTFNSLSIEALLWRIPGLSEHFIYFNDDLLVCRSISPEVFFPSKGHINCHGHKASLRLTKAWFSLKHLVGRSCQVNHIRQMMHAAEITGNKHIFIRLSHTPHPLLRSTLQQFYESHPDYLVQNIRNRFRSKEHFRSDELCYMQLWNEGRLHLRPVRPVLMRYYHRKGMMQLEWTLRRVTKPGSTVCFACFYALDQVTDKIFARITQFVEELLDGQR